MFNILRFKSSKKGILALESILSLILSVIILFFIFQTFYNAFLQTPTNLKIAEDNAKSIVEFVDYSNNKYSTYNNCYTILKLKNLENYQYKSKDGKNYFYIIDRTGVKIYNKDNFEAFLDNNNFDFNSYVKKVDFKYTKQISMEILPLSIHTFNVIFKVSSLINSYFAFNLLDPFVGYMDNLKKFYSEVEISNSNQIVIFPVFGKYLFGKDISVSFNLGSLVNFDLTSNNQNILYALNYERITTTGGILNRASNTILNSVNFDSHYLVYKPDSKVFSSYTMDSENFIKKNLCEFKELLTNSQNQIFQNKDKYFNQINKNKYVEILDNNNNKYKLVYRENEKICYKNNILINCEIIFGENINNLNYNSFITKIQNFPNRKKGVLGDVKFEDKTQSQFIKDLLIENQDGITIDLIKNDNLDPKYDVYILKSNILSNMISYIFSTKNKQEYINSCKKEICNYLLFDKNSKKIYFYDNNNFHNFVSINPIFFEKKYLGSNILKKSEPFLSIGKKYRENYNLYFNKNEIFVYSIVGIGNNLLQARNNFYYVEIPILKNKKFQVISSPQILNQIPILNYNKK